MNKFKICGMCRNFYAGKCVIKDNERVDCLDKRCEDFKSYFDKGD